MPGISFGSTTARARENVFVIFFHNIHTSVLNVHDFDHLSESSHPPRHFHPAAPASAHPKSFPAPHRINLAKMTVGELEFPPWALYVYFFLVLTLSPALLWFIFSANIWDVDLEVAKFLRGFTLFLLLNAAVAFPAKLLRVPKIYNALITSKEKILPSEAYPATTGPIFQPLGLAGEPILIHPELLMGKPKPLEVADGTEVKLPEGLMRSSKPPAPITFYPRYSLYYPHQPYLTLQQSLLYSQLFEVPHQNAQHMIPKELEVEEKKDLTLQNTRMNPPIPPIPPMISPAMEYVKNNRPADRNIPDIPPPPPPVRFREIEQLE